MKLLSLQVSRRQFAGSDQERGLVRVVLETCALRERVAAGHARVYGAILGPGRVSGRHPIAGIGRPRAGAQRLAQRESPCGRSEKSKRLSERTRSGPQPSALRRRGGRGPGGEDFPCVVTAGDDRRGDGPIGPPLSSITPMQSQVGSPRTCLLLTPYSWRGRVGSGCGIESGYAGERALVLRVHKVYALLARDPAVDASAGWQG